MDEIVIYNLQCVLLRQHMVTHMLTEVSEHPFVVDFIMFWLCTSLPACLFAKLIGTRLCTLSTHPLVTLSLPQPPQQVKVICVNLGLFQSDTCSAGWLLLLNLSAMCKLMNRRWKHSTSQAAPQILVFLSFLTGKLMSCMPNEALINFVKSNRCFIFVQCQWKWSVIS